MLHYWVHVTSQPPGWEYKYRDKHTQTCRHKDTDTKTLTLAGRELEMLLARDVKPLSV